MNTTFRRWLAGFGLAIGCGVGLTAGEPAEMPIIYTKSTALRLPIQVDESSRGDIVEVRLYVKGPTGKRQLADTIPADRPHVDFRAQGDGEYRFTFVTVDRRGQAVPADVESAPPHRIVAIDTRAPEVFAQPIPARGGNPMLQVQIRDAHPDWSSLKVSYPDSAGKWNVLTPAAADTPSVFRVPFPSVLSGRIRVTAADRAGHIVEREIDLGDPTLPSFPIGEESARGGPATKPPIPVAPPRGGDPSSELFPPDLKRPETVDRNPVVRPLDTKGTMVPGDAGLPPIPPDPGRTPGVANAKKDEPRSLPGPIIRGPSDIKPPSDIVVPGDIRQASDNSTPLPSIPHDDRSLSLKLTNVPKDVVLPPDPQLTRPQTPAETAAPKHKVLNSPICIINYELEGAYRVNPRVDFWATADGGRTWVSLKDANAGVPPAKLTLPADGVYGIRIRPGAGNRPPDANEEPDAVVEVDTRKPDVSLLQPSLGSGSDAGTMTITWTAADKNLLGNSINLQYAVRVDGPWRSIVSGYRNEGIYKWTLPTGLSGAIYLRVEAADRAGNIGRYDLPAPVAVESGKGRVKVTSIGNE